MNFIEKYRWGIIAISGTLIIHLAVLIYIYWEEWPTPQAYSIVELDYRSEPDADPRIDPMEDPEIDKVDPDSDLSPEQMAKLNNITANLGQETKYTSNKSQAQIDAEIQAQIDALGLSTQEEIEAKRALESKKEDPSVNDEHNPLDEKLFREEGGNDAAVQGSSGKADMVGYFIYGDVTRNDMRTPAPSYVCKESGTVVIKFKLNRNGEIESPKVGSSVSINGTNFSTTTNNECLIANAIKYAKRSKFNENYAAPRTQDGVIVYRYGAQ